MRMNRSMAKRLKNLDLEGLLASIPLSDKLNALAEAQIIQTEVFILKPLLELGFDISAFFDKTDYEATLNHIHISDFLEEKKGRSDIHASTGYSVRHQSSRTTKQHR